MESLTALQDGNGAFLCISGSRFTRLMGYYLSKTVMTSNVL